MLNWCGTISIRFDLQLNSGTVFPHTCMKVSLFKTTVCGAVNVLVALFLAIIQGRVVCVIL